MVRGVEEGDDSGDYGVIFGVEDLVNVLGVKGRLRP